MKTLLLLALSLLGMAGAVRGQGFGVVRFANDAGSAVYDVDGVTRLAGSTFQAALFWGPPDLMESWVQAGPASPFVSDGIWMAANRTLPALAGTTVGLQVRFWDSENGRFGSFEQAEASGVKIGVSKPIVVILNPPLIPTPMSGLQSAGLVPTITLTRGLPGLFTDSSTVPNGTQLTSLCGRAVGLNRWFRLTSPYAGETLVTTMGSSIDTVMSAYTGSMISPSTLSVITCNDDRAPDATASEVRFAIEANKLYLLCVAGKNGVSGTIRLNHTLLTGLDIRRTEAERIELSWPADATNFVAESLREFPGEWRGMTNAVEMVGHRRVVRIDCTEPLEIYRLRLKN